jgi:rhomboid protease GluP
MAFGLPASFSQYIPLNNLSKLEFQYVAILSCQKLNWTIITLNDEELIAETNSSLHTWNEKITINYQFADPFVLSESNGNQLYDRGRNKKEYRNLFNR